MNKHLQLEFDVLQLRKKIKARVRQEDNIGRAISHLNHAKENLNQNKHSCGECGFGVWEDEPENRISMGLSKAIKQAHKMKVMARQDIHDLRDQIKELQAECNQ